MKKKKLSFIAALSVFSMTVTSVTGNGGSNGE